MRRFTFLRPSWLRDGILLLGCATVLWLFFERLADNEQAQAPGEKDLGIGVLGILFLIPTVILATAGFGCLITSLFIAVRRRFVRANSK